MQCCCRTQAQFAGWAGAAAQQHGYAVQLHTLGHACMEAEAVQPGSAPGGATQVLARPRNCIVLCMAHLLCSWQAASRVLKTLLSNMQVALFVRL